MVDFYSPCIDYQWQWNVYQEVSVPEHCASVHACESVSIVNQHLLVLHMCVRAQCAGYWSCMCACEMYRSSLWIVVYCYWYSQWRDSRVGMSTMGALVAERSGLNRSNCDLMFCPLSSNWAGEIPVVLCRVQMNNSLAILSGIDLSLQASFLDLCASPLKGGWLIP